MKANCAVCGKEFEKLRTAITCDEKCSKQRRLEVKRRRYPADNERRRRKSEYTKPIGICIVCGGEFKKRTTAKTCSNKCLSQIKRKNRRAYYRANLEKERDARRTYYRNNRKKRREYHQEWRQANPEYSRKMARKYREANPEHYRAMNRKNRLANAEKRLDAKQKRRSFMNAAKILGIPPLVYAAMKLANRISTLEQQNEDSRPKG